MEGESSREGRREWVGVGLAGVRVGQAGRQVSGWCRQLGERTSGVEGKRVDLGGRRIVKKKRGKECGSRRSPDQ